MRSLERVCGVEEDVHLGLFLSKLTVPQSGIYKCRIVYDENKMEVEFLPYNVKPISKLKLVEGNSVSYEFKYADRQQFENLYLQKGDCDDILIYKDGLVTDSSYANIVFKKNNDWITPWSALLQGTMRQKLLEFGQIIEDEIRVKEILSFQSFKLVNAMLGFDGPKIDVANIVS